jgi:hypothetical protein
MQANILEWINVIILTSFLYWEFKSQYHKKTHNKLQMVVSVTFDLSLTFTNCLDFKLSILFPN